MPGRFLNYQPRKLDRIIPVGRASALKIVACYVLFGCLWILFSDELLSSLVANKDLLTRLEIVKGWAFIAVTAAMIYLLISRSLASLQKSNAALAASEARFRGIAESNMIGIIFWKSDGLIVDANDAFLKTVGYTRQDLLEGKVNWLYMTPPEYRRQDDHANEERISQGSSFTYEKEYIRKDGTRAYVLIGLGTLDEAEGIHTAFVLDITERKRVEKALRESERRLREILENIKLAAVMFDPEGTVTFCNDFLLELTGWRMEEVTGRNWFDTFIPFEQRELIRFTFDEMLKKGASPAHIEYEIQTRGKERKIISWSNTVSRDSLGKILCTIGIGEDVTERRRFEEKLLSSYEDLRALSAHLQSVREEERVRIAREIHDVLGQALTGLKMDVWWLIKRASASDNPPERTAFVERFEAMSKLINDTIQSVRKLATELRPGILDDLGLVAAIEWQAKEFQSRTGINCHLSLPEADIPLGSEQSTAVFRIFQEILTNVARHAGARNVEIKMAEREGELVLEVKDDGKGIAENKVSGARSLGLLGMRERAMLFGGEVRIRRAGERGTIVAVRIPLAKKSSSVAEKARTQGVA